MKFNDGDYAIHKSGEFCLVQHGWDTFAAVEMTVPNTDLYPTTLTVARFCDNLYPCREWRDRLARVNPYTFYQWRTFWARIRDRKAMSYFYRQIGLKKSWVGDAPTSFIRRQYPFEQVWIKTLETIRESEVDND